MTGPAVNWNGWLNGTDPSRQKEFDANWSGVMDFYNKFSQVLNGPKGAQVPQGPVIPPHPAWTDEDLVGAAQYWGMSEDGARALPRDVLIKFVSDNRNNARQSGVSTAANVLAPLAQFGVGAAEGLTGTLLKIPGIGDWLNRGGAVREADQWFRQLEEGVRASTSDGAMQTVESVANVGGNLASMWYPGTAAWAVSGKIGKLIPMAERLSPIGRAALQGGLSSYLLAGGVQDPLDTQYGQVGGTQDPWTHRAESFGTGAILGGVLQAAAPMIGKLAQKVQDAYTVKMPEDLRGGASTPPAPPAPPGVPQLPGGPSPITDPGRLLPEGDFGRLQRMADGGDQQAQEILKYMQPGDQTKNLGYYPMPGVPDGDGVELLGAMRQPSAASEGEQLVVQANKAGMIVQSPDFPKIAAQPQLGDMAVAQAAASENPGGTSILQGITDPQALVKSLGRNVRFVNKAGRLDALMSDEPIPDIAAEEYEKFGLFTGQKVLTAEGMEARVRGVLDPSTVLLQMRNGAVAAEGFAAPVSEVHPWMTSPSVMEVPGLWDAFQQEALGKAAKVQAAMGGGLSPENLTTVMTQNQPFWMHQFFKDVGIFNPGDQARVGEYFNQRYVSSFKELAPLENMRQDMAVAQAVETPSAVSPVGQLDQAAAVKGFTAVPQGGDRWTLQSGPTKIDFPTRDAAQTYVQQLNRELPDVTPPSSVPVEVAAMQPTGAPQESNEATDALPRIASAVNEMETEIGAPPAGHGPPEIAAARGDYAGLNSRLQAARSWWSPLRRTASQLDQILYENDRGHYNLAQDVDGVQLKQNLYHTDMAPFQDRLADLLAPVHTDKMRTGEWTQVYEEMDPTKQLEMAKRLNWTPKEFNSLQKYENLMQDIFPDTGLDEIRQIPRYITHIAQRQSDEATRLTAFDDFPLGPTTQPFWQMMRTGNLNFREMDPRVLGDAYIRSVFWQKHLEEPWEAARAKWSGIAKDDPTIEPASSAMLDWLSVMKNGYDLKDDFVLNTAHEFLKTMVDPSVTRSQAKEVVLGGLNGAYSGMIGFRPKMIVRHFLQLAYAFPRAGDDLAGTLGRFMSSSDARSAIVNEAISDGAISTRQQSIVAPGDFSGELETVGSAGGSSEHTARYNLLAKLQGTLRDAMPDALKGHSDSIFRPMGAFSQAVEKFRAITYVAGKQRAANAIAEFRAAGESGDLGQLMDNSMMSSFAKPWQREFMNHLSTSDDEAAKFAGRQLLKATFFDYGASNGPNATKSVTGRIGWQLGIYPMNYLAMWKEVLGTGNSSVITKHLMAMATTTAALYGASKATGWGMNWLNPWSAVGWGTGPMVDAAASMSKGLEKVKRGMSEGDQTSYQQGMTGLTNTAINTAAGMTPIGGLVAGARDFQQIGASPSPISALGEWATTGEVNSSGGVWPSQGSQEFQQQLQPYTSPVRGMAIPGMQPGQTSPQPVVDPPLVQNPNQLNYLTTPGTASTAPTNGLPQPGGLPVYPRP